MNYNTANTKLEKTLSSDNIIRDLRSVYEKYKDVGTSTGEINLSIMAKDCEAFIQSQEAYIRCLKNEIEHTKTAKSKYYTTISRDEALKRYLENPKHNKYYRVDFYHCETSDIEDCSLHDMVDMYDVFYVEVNNI